MQNRTVIRPRRAWVSVLAGSLVLMLGTDFTSAQQGAAARAELTWRVVVNNGVTVPGDTRRFNSYNEPSLNVYGLVVFRARSKGGPSGEPAHGVFIRDMAVDGPIGTIFDRNTLVPAPNNLGTMFAEPPSFPRIDMWSNMVASRGNHAPAHAYLLPDQSETRGWTNGIYTNPFSSLVTGTGNLGGVPGFEAFVVPDASLALRFEVFPGAPSPTGGATIVFKGNYSAPDPGNPAATIGKTGVYYRDLWDAPAGGAAPVTLIASSDTLIPGTVTTFGSTAPPSAVQRHAVFAGFDNEWNPTQGGIYLAPLTGPNPPLTALVSIGDGVPGEPEGVVFNRLGEGLSFDGRFVAFWGAWGSTVTTLILQCPEEGNKERIAFCNQTYPTGFQTTVPFSQGIFVHDVQTGQTSAVAKTPGDFSDFVYWNFSGRVPGSMGHPEEDGEPARWRSASFVSVSGLVDGGLIDPTFHAVFKARTGQVMNGAYSNPIDGIYLRTGPQISAAAAVVETGMDATLFDPEAVDPLTQDHLSVTEMGIERESFRGQWLTINVRMGAHEDTGWAGIYLTAIPNGCTTIRPGFTWVCVNGGWVPPDHPLAAGTPPPPPPGAGCTTTRPGPVWVCVNGGWLPPDHPLARGGG